MHHETPASHSDRSHTDTPFFADAILDLDEAHDIAETPETAMKPIQLLPTSALMDGGLHLPVLEETTSPRSLNRIQSLQMDDATQLRPATLPRWPRDWQFVVAFWCTAPVTLIWPLFHTNWSSPLAHHPLSSATWHVALWACLFSWILCRFLYRSLSGGEGEGTRILAAQALTMSAIIHVTVLMGLCVMLWMAVPTARVVVLVPLAAAVRNIWLVRRWKRPTETGSRAAFFQVLVNAALDILSRSLRRESFYRLLGGILLVQLVVVLLCRWAILASLSQNNTTMLLLTLLGGKWATGTVTRMLTLLASGGVMGWFLEQAMLLQDVPTPKQRGRLATQDDDDDDLVGGIPEAYRTVDASVYQSVLDMDDAALDDDFDDEELEGPNQNHATAAGSMPREPYASSTVKSILWAGLTVSFGSVAECGLLGGLAQFVWSQVRKVEAARSAVQQTRQNRDGGFRGMQIGGDTSLVSKLWSRVDHVLRAFVSRFTDMAMTHVAAYYKNYQRAARDVTVLIEESGRTLTICYSPSLWEAELPDPSTHPSL